VKRNGGGTGGDGKGSARARLAPRVFPFSPQPPRPGRAEPAPRAGPWPVGGSPGAFPARQRAATAKFLPLSRPAGAAAIDPAAVPPLTPSASPLPAASPGVGGCRPVRGGGVEGLWVAAKAACDRCPPLTALGASPVAPCHWLSAADRQGCSL